VSTGGELGQSAGMVLNMMHSALSGSSTAWAGGGRRLALADRWPWLLDQGHSMPTRPAGGKAR